MLGAIHSTSIATMFLRGPLLKELRRIYHHHQHHHPENTIRNLQREALAPFTSTVDVDILESSKAIFSIAILWPVNAILDKMYFLGRRERTPTPKTRFSIWTLLRTPGRFTTRPLPVYFTTKMSVVRPFSVLSKDEIGP